MPEIDAGPIVFQESVSVGREETGLSLTVKCVNIGVPLISRLLEAAAQAPSNIPLIPQDLSKREYFGREVPANGNLSWNRPAQRIVDFVRVSNFFPFRSPWGIPRTKRGDSTLGILKARVTGTPVDAPPGTVGTERSGGVEVASADEWILVRQVFSGRNKRSNSSSAQAWGPVGRLLEHASFQMMTRAMDYVADSLLRLTRSRHRPAVGQIGPEDVPIPAKQREVRFSDFENVARLQERGGFRKDNQENWCRLWRQNPALAVAKSQLSMGWVLETAQGIVGYQGSIPLLYQFGGRTLVAAVGTGLVIEPAYRARCIGLMASFYRQRGVDLFLLTFAAPSVVELSKALHATALNQHCYDKKLFWVLDAHQFAKARAARAREKFALGSGMVAVGTFLGSSVLRADTLRRGPRGRLTNKFGVTEIEVKDIGDEFEALWQRKLTETPRLFADRSPASLRWHFTLPGSSSTVAVLCCHRFERLVGYAIVLHTIDRETGMRRSMLADILVEQDDPSVTETLLEAAYSNAVASGGHLFEVVGLPRHITQILMRWNPYVRRCPTDPLIYKTADEALARTLADENAWYAGPFDGDATLMP